MSHKGLTFLWISLYFIGFHYIYTDFLWPTYGYLGNIESVEFNSLKVLISFLSIVIPIYWLPQKIQRPTQTIFWLVYVMVYIPTMILVENSMGEHFYQICLYMFLGNAVIGFSYKVPLPNWQFFQVSPAKILNFCLITVAIVCLGLLATQYDKIGFADPLDGDEVYKQRLEKNINLGWLLYPFVIGNNVLLPWAWIYSIHTKNTKALLFCSLVQVFLYMIFANKVFLVTFLLSYLVYRMLSKSDLKYGLKMSAYLTMMVYLGGVFLFLFFDNPDLLSIRNIFILFIVRGIGICIINFPLYYDFFVIQGNPLTHMSHVKIVSKLIHYPYPKDISLVIGEFYYNDEASNPNANFMITDGISAFGVPGILISCIFCAVVFWFLDTLSQKHHVAFSSAIFVTGSMILINTSLFTTLLTGGLGLLGVLLWLMAPIQLPPRAAKLSG